MLCLLLILGALAYIALVLTKPELQLQQQQTMKATAEEVLRNSQTGDILLYKGFNASPGLLFVNPYTHISTIIRDANNKPYSVEIHASGDGVENEKEGVYAYPLEYRLSSNGKRTQMYWVRLQSQQNLPANTGSTVLAWLPEIRRRIRYNTNYIRDMVVCHFFHVLPGDITKRMHCANFASALLQMMKIAVQDQDIGCIRPIDVVSSSLKLEPPFSYRPIIQITSSSS